MRIEKKGLLVTIVIAGLMCSCIREDTISSWTYREISSGVSQRTAWTPFANGLTWDLPSGWQEILTSSQMRRVFLPTQKALEDRNIEISLTSFPGDVGGLRQNLIRWLRQIGRVLSEEELKRFRASVVQKTNGFGVEYTWVDSRVLTGEVCVIVAIVALPDRKVFVKMIGERSCVEETITSFRFLCESMRMDSSKR